MHKSNIFNRYVSTSIINSEGNSNANLMASRKFYKSDYGQFYRYPLINYPDEIKVDNIAQSKR